MSWVKVHRTQIDVNGTTPLAVTNSPAAALNDVLYAAVTSFTTDTVTGPSGWSVIKTADSGAGEAKVQLWKKIAGGSEPTSYSWSSTMGTLTTIDFFQLTGADASTQEDVTPSSNTAASVLNIDATGLTTVTDGCMLIAWWLESGAAGAITRPTSMTPEGQLLATGFPLALASASLQQGSKGATGNKNGSWAATTAAGAILLAVRPTTPLVTLYPTTNAAYGAGRNFTSPNNAHADDGTDATDGPSTVVGSCATKWGTFGFDAILPVGATIVAVKVTIEDGTVTAATNTQTLSSIPIVSAVDQTKRTLVVVPTDDTYPVLHTTDHTADRSWTRGDLLDAAFEVAVNMDFTGAGGLGHTHSINLDFVRVEVAYTTGGGGGGPAAPALLGHAHRTRESIRGLRKGPGPQPVAPATTAWASAVVVPSAILRWPWPQPPVAAPPPGWQPVPPEWLVEGVLALPVPVPRILAQPVVPAPPAAPQPLNQQRPIAPSEATEDIVEFGDAGQSVQGLLRPREAFPLRPFTWGASGWIASVVPDYVNARDDHDPDLRAEPAPPAGPQPLPTAALVHDQGQPAVNLDRAILRATQPTVPAPPAAAQPRTAPTAWHATVIADFQFTIVWPQPRVPQGAPGPQPASISWMQGVSPDRAVLRADQPTVLAAPPGSQPPARSVLIEQKGQPPSFDQVVARVAQPVVGAPPAAAQPQPDPEAWMASVIADYQFVLIWPQPRIPAPPAGTQPLPDNWTQGVIADFPVSRVTQPVVPAPFVAAQPPVDIATLQSGEGHRTPPPTPQPVVGAPRPGDQPRPIDWLQGVVDDRAVLRVAQPAVGVAPPGPQPLVTIASWTPSSDRAIPGPFQWGTPAGRTSPDRTPPVGVAYEAFPDRISFVDVRQRIFDLGPVPSSQRSFTATVAFQGVPVAPTTQIGRAWPQPPVGSPYVAGQPLAAFAPQVPFDSGFRWRVFQWGAPMGAVGAQPNATTARWAPRAPTFGPRPALQFGVVAPRTATQPRKPAWVATIGGTAAVPETTVGGGFGNRALWARIQAERRRKKRRDEMALAMLGMPLGEDDRLI